MITPNDPPMELVPTTFLQSTPGASSLNFKVFSSIDLLERPSSNTAIKDVLLKQTCVGVNRIQIILFTSPAR